MPIPIKPSIVFAHGLWADGSCFSKLIPTLQADGHEVVAAQNSLDTLQGDVAAVTRALGRVRSPAILVGHSYGGTVITAAGSTIALPGLVYIAALAPDESETSQSLQSKFPHHRHFLARRDRRRACLDAPGWRRVLRRRLTDQEQKVILATQGVPALDLLEQKVKGTAWKTKPSWYIVAKHDRTVHPDLERFCAKRMGATTYEAASSHVPMLSKPHLVIDVIRVAANAVAQSTAAPAQYEHRPSP